MSTLIKACAGLAIVAGAAAGQVTVVPVARNASATSGAAGPDSLPRELVIALLRPYGGGLSRESEFFVGKMPPALEPYLYVPPGARILGGFSSPSGVTAVLAVRGVTFEDVAMMYAREQPKLGWTAPPSAMDMRGWGFSPPPSANPMGSGLEFCHIGQSLQIMPSQEAGLSYVTAQVQNFGGRCSYPNRAATGGRPTPQAVLPLLTNPVGALMSQQTCYPPSPSPSGSSATSERLQVSQSPAQLLEYFAKQLADSGWTPLQTTGVSVRRQWTRPDTGSVGREVTLTVTPATGTACYDVSMQVRAIPVIKR